ncbi:MAG: hypothetical protein LBR66_02280 [Candidatus Symbiothrix sp.]|jgi:hypothetical protein|nr:hypothetical protein [Candidatus Symbiothrix sp.]
MFYSAKVHKKNVIQSFCIKNFYLRRMPPLIFDVGLVAAQKSFVPILQGLGFYAKHPRYGRNVNWLFFNPLSLKKAPVRGPSSRLSATRRIRR